jgi:hypothetical protein
MPNSGAFIFFCYRPHRARITPSSGHRASGPSSPLPWSASRVSRPMVASSLGRAVWRSHRRRRRARGSLTATGLRWAGGGRWHRVHSRAASSPWLDGCQRQRCTRPVSKARRRSYPRAKCSSRGARPRSAFLIKTLCPRFFSEAGKSFLPGIIENPKIGNTMLKAAFTL